MANNELALPASFGKPPASIALQPGANDELGAGVASSYGVVGYRGKVWSIKFGGEETQLMRDDGDGPRNSIEVIIVKASPAISKIFYKQGYVDGSNAAPDCWSSNGVAPDNSVQNKVNPTCANCPMNAWGSRTTDAGKQAKACSDSRRVAVVPVADIANELTGGPMLLRVPAASLKDLKAYGELLSSYQYPYYAAATRISFDAAEAFPKFVFSAIRPLTAEEVAQVMELREGQQVTTVLAERPDGSMGLGAAEAAKPVPSSPFEQAATAPAQPEAQAAQQAPKPAPAPTQQAAAKPAAKPAQKPAAAPVTAAGNAPQTAAQKLAAAQAELARLAAEAAAEEAAAAAQAQTAATAARASVAELLSQGSDEENEDAVDEDSAPEDPAQGTPSQFDDMLEGIL